jgi:hypothetical protein
MKSFYIILHKQSSCLVLYQNITKHGKSKTIYEQEVIEKDVFVLAQWV